MLTVPQQKEETFASALQITFVSIMDDGYAGPSKVQHNTHLLKNAALTTLTQAHSVFQEFQGRMLAQRSTNSTAIFTDTSQKWKADLMQTERILEVGRVVGEDKINMKIEWTRSGRPRPYLQ